MGLFDVVNPFNLSCTVTSPAHNALARSFAAQAHVLLKNDKNVLPLPLQPTEVYKIALLGGPARIDTIVAGGGSGSVFPSHIVSPYEGVCAKLGLPPPAPLNYSCDLERVWKNTFLDAASSQSLPSNSLEQCCAQCGTYPTCHYFSFDGSTCYLRRDNSSATFRTGIVTGRCNKVVPPPQWLCNSAKVCVAVDDGNDFSRAATLAREANVAVVFEAAMSGEGHDRSTLAFDPAQDALVAQLAIALNQTGTPIVVAMANPGAMLTPWREDVAAVLSGWMPGQEYGHGLADVLFGQVNPSARLPVTFPNTDNEQRMSRLQYPGVNLQSNYTEKLLFGYRWYDANAVTPAFAFGHGLSYTTFSYAELVISRPNLQPHGQLAPLVIVTANVTNSGVWAGCEVAQLYLQFPYSAGEPPLQLKGFVKTAQLVPGASVLVNFPLLPRDLSVWDENLHIWVQQTGTFVAFVGASSADFRLSGSFSL
jgi:hypothetical protein